MQNKKNLSVLFLHLEIFISKSLILKKKKNVLDLKFFMIMQKIIIASIIVITINLYNHNILEMVWSLYFKMTKKKKNLIKEKKYLKWINKILQLNTRLILKII